MKHHTTGGYTYDTPEIHNQPDVNISLSYEDAYDTILDGLEGSHSIEPMDPTTFALNAVNLLGLLIDASEDLNEA